MKELPPGGPAPRTADGHPDLTGRWYPNGAGRMLQRTYMTFFGKDVRRQFDPKVVQEEPPVFKPGMEAKYRGKGGLSRFRGSVRLGGRSQCDFNANHSKLAHAVDSNPGTDRAADRIPQGHSRYTHRRTSSSQRSGSYL